MGKFLLGLGLATAFATTIAPARASYILVGDTAHSTSNLGDFSGTLTYSASSATAATLTVTLTNTSRASNGGDLTAFVLNNPSALISGIALTSAPANFGLLGAAPFDGKSVNAAPFGSFDFGASTSGGFEGGGAPSKGLGVGATGTFVFSLTGTSLETLNASSFASPLSVGPGDGMGNQSFVARFRGFNDGGSDKVPAAPQAVPEPTSFALLGLGLGAAALFRPRRRRNP